MNTWKLRLTFHHSFLVSDHVVYGGVIIDHINAHILPTAYLAMLTLHDKLTNEEMIPIKNGETHYT